jgi:cell division protein ZapA
LAEVAISINKRTYHFACGENEVQRLGEVANYLKSKLDKLVREHGAIGDERLILMAALMVADELFDARADVDDLLDGRTEDLKSFADAAAGETPAEKSGGRFKTET